MLALSSLAFRSFISNRLRTAVLITAVLLGIAGISGVQLTNDAISQGVERNWRTAVGESDLQLRTFSPTGFSDASVASVRALPEVVRVAPIARKWVFFRTQDLRGFVELIAVDPAAEREIRSYRLQAGEFLSGGRPDGLVARASWAQDHGLRVGDTFELITRDGLRDFRLVGVLAPDEAGIATYGSVVLIGLDTARQRFGMQDRVSAMSLLLSSPGAIAQVSAALPRAISEGHAIRRSEDIRAALEQSLAELQATLTLFGATALFISVFLILNTIEMTVASQTQQTGRLRACGATRGQIFVYFLEQGLFPGAVGALAGALVGYDLALALATWIERTQDVGVAPVAFSLPILVLSVLLGVVVVGLGSIAPALRATRVNPIEMLAAGASESDRGAGYRVLGLGLGLLGLAVVALVVPVPGQGGRLLRAAALFPLLGGLVAISRMAIRPMSELLGIPILRFGSAPERLAARNLTRHPGRTTLTIAGFMVSLSLLIAVTSVALSSARAGERWTRSLIPGDYVVVSPVDQPEVFIGEFRKLSRVRRASPVGFFPVQSGDSVLQVASIEPEVFVRGFEFLEGSAPEADAAMKAGGAVLIPQRLARERGLKLGDPLPLQTPGGRQPFRIVGVVAHSFPSPDGARTVLLGRGDAERLFDRRGFRLIMVEAAPGEDASAVREQVSELAERYGMSAVTADQISSDVALAIWHLLALIGALVGIGVVIGAVGTANTMCMNIAERTRELNILWAAGMSRAHLQLMTVAEAELMGLMGGVLGTVIGGALSWLLVSLSRTSGFEPEYVFPLPAAIAGIGVTLLASAAAAYGPARTLGRLEGMF